MKLKPKMKPMKLMDDKMGKETDELKARRLAKRKGRTPMDEMDMMKRMK